VQRLGGAARRGTIVALLAAVVAFGVCFAIARSLAGDGASSAAAPTRKVPDRLVTISNLERAPSIKPLRSVAGAPPSATPPSAPASAAGAP
jgi:hypothetical protein